MIFIKNSLLITVVIAVIAAAGAFYGGMQYQKSNTSQNQARGQNQAGAFRRGTGQGLRATRGTILTVDDKSLTVKLQDGSSKIVILSDKTVYMKSDKASLTDLKTGDTVAVFGADNTDGSVTAQNVQLNPMGGFRGENRQSQ